MPRLVCNSICYRLLINNPLDCGCNLNGTREEICDILVGTCFCIPNVTGDKCDRCVSGFYGDPVNNVPCRPCECPGSGLTLSPTCVLDSDNSFTCDNCTTGYSGRRCELCADDYYRTNPEVCVKIIVIAVSK